MAIYPCTYKQALSGFFFLNHMNLGGEGGWGHREGLEEKERG